MTTNSSTAGPINTYPKWVGVVMGLFLCGSAHFLAGSRLRGILWWAGISLCNLLIIVAMLATNLGIIYIAAIMGGMTLILWLIMLGQSYRPVPRIGFIGWIALFLLAFTISLLEESLADRYVASYFITSAVMQPTLTPGDYIFVNKLAYRTAEPQRGDIVVFVTQHLSASNVSANTLYCMRIAGLPGEEVQIVPPDLLIDGQALKSPDIFRRISERENGFAGYTSAIRQPNEPISLPPDGLIHLGPDDFFVLGDNSARSKDSRFWGPVPKSAIIGQAVRVYWPPSRAVSLQD